MTLEQMEALLDLLEAAYPTLRFTQPKSLVAKIWHLFFKEYTFDEVAKATKMFISEDISGFPPSIGQLLAVIRNNNKEVNHE